LEDAEQQLKFANAHANQARKNIESLRSRLAAQGQTVNPDTTAAMARAETALSEAESALGRRDLQAAHDYTQRAEYELKRVFQAVGN
jgi:hypothetical protein